jgi:hypothetical protein
MEILAESANRSTWKNRRRMRPRRGLSAPIAVRQRSETTIVVGYPADQRRYAQGHRDPDQAGEKSNEIREYIRHQEREDKRLDLKAARTLAM